VVALSAAEQSDLLDEVTSSLAHTYTRTTRAVDTSNPDFETFNDVATVSNAPCFYGTRSRGRREEIGKSVSHEPQFIVAAFDPLAAGDLVSDVRDADAVLLLAGPLVVMAVEPMAAAGVALDKHVQLEAAQAAPAAETG
jgi:hypothetical protein